MSAAEVVVRAAIAPLHAEARASSPQISQRLAGHRLAVLAREGAEWLRVRGDDGYEGWVHRGYVVDAPPGAHAPPHTVSLGCTVVDARTGVRRALPLGAHLTEHDRLESGEALEVEALAARFPAEGGAIARSAVERFAGTPYQWGGITPWGADCSGLVQSVFRLHGLALPRDAWQQGEIGVAAPEDVTRLRAGDLPFFSDRADGRITHVGIALGEARMVHLALGRGGYAVERLDDLTDPYVRALRERFVGARRVLA